MSTVKELIEDLADYPTIFFSEIEEYYENLMDREEIHPNRVDVVIRKTGNSTELAVMFVYPKVGYNRESGKVKVSCLITGVTGEFDVRWITGFNGSYMKITV